MDQYRISQKVTEFFRFPHTPHITWLGQGEPRGDKLLSPSAMAELLTNPVIIEEKIDGANIGISWGTDGQIQVQNRGSYLESPYRGQFSRMNQWLMTHLSDFQQHLPDHLILFGEWAAARHSLDYQALPDWFMVFDVYDRTTKRFWNVERRNALVHESGLHHVPELARGIFSLSELENIVRTGKSQYRKGRLEGIVVRQDGDEWCENRAKLVHPDFVQQIEDHWRSRTLEWNKVDSRVSHSLGGQGQ